MGWTENSLNEKHPQSMDEFLSRHKPKKPHQNIPACKTLSLELSHFSSILILMIWKITSWIAKIK